MFFCPSQAYGVFVPFVRINIKTNTVKSQTPGCYNPEVSLLSDYVQPVTQTDDISASFRLNTSQKQQQEHFKGDDRRFCSSVPADEADAENQTSKTLVLSLKT